MDAIKPKSITTIDASESNLISAAPVPRKDPKMASKESKMVHFESHNKNIDKNVVDHSMNSANETIEIKKLKDEIISCNAKINTHDGIQEKETAKNHQFVQSIESLDIKDNYPMIGKDARACSPSLKPNPTTIMMPCDDLIDVENFWYAAHQGNSILADWTRYIFDRG